MIPRLSIATWKEWQEAYDTAAERHFFLSPLWARAVHAAYPEIRPRALCFTFPTHRVVLPCAITRKMRGCLLGLRSMPPWHYGGLLSQKPLEPATLTAIAERISRVPWLHTAVIAASPGREMKGWAPLCTNAFFTHAIDLAGGHAEVCHNSHFKKQACQARKAERAGITLRKDNSESAVESFYRLYLMSCERWHLATPEPKALLSTLAADPGGSVALWLASLEGKDIAGILVTEDSGERAYQLTAVSDAAYWNLGPNNLLYTRALIDACERGLKQYDFLPSNGLAGVVRFKETFGAVPTPVQEYWLPGLFPSLKHRIRRLTKPTPAGEEGPRR